MNQTHTRNEWNKYTDIKHKKHNAIYQRQLEMKKITFGLKSVLVRNTNLKMDERKGKKGEVRKLVSRFFFFFLCGKQRVKKQHTQNRRWHINSN